MCTVWYDMLRYTVVHYDAIWYETVQCVMIQYSTIKCDNVHVIPIYSNPKNKHQNGSTKITLQRHLWDFPSCLLSVCVLQWFKQKKNPRSRKWKLLPHLLHLHSLERKYTSVSVCMPLLLPWQQITLISKHLQMCMTSLIEWTVLVSWASSTLPHVQLVLLIIDGCLWRRTVMRV